MKKILKIYLYWLIFGSWIFTILCIGYLAIKARTTSNPWLNDSDPSALYVNTNETLTAAKRNTVVNILNGKYSSIIRCAKVDWTSGFAKWKKYDCDGNIIWTTSSSSDVTISCPSGYFAIEWWYYSSVAPLWNYISTNYSYISTTWTLNYLDVRCIK